MTRLQKSEGLERIGTVYMGSDSQLVIKIDHLPGARTDLTLDDLSDCLMGVVYDQKGDPIEVYSTELAEERLKHLGLNHSELSDFLNGLAGDKRVAWLTPWGD